MVRTGKSRAGSGDKEARCPFVPIYTTHTARFIFCGSDEPHWYASPEAVARTCIGALVSLCTQSVAKQHKNALVSLCTQSVAKRHKNGTRLFMHSECR